MRRPPKISSGRVRTWPPSAQASPLTAARFVRPNGAVAGSSSVQSDPSQLHVSPEVGPAHGSHPPNRIDDVERGSNAMAPNARAGGIVPGDYSVQLVPSHVQVSSRRPALSVRLPPKRTTSWRTGS